MANKVGALIKEARTGAKLTQEQLAAQISGVTANDISKAERGDKELSQSVLKQIAKLTGVTQASLVNAAKESTYTGTATAAVTTAKKPAASSKKATTATAAAKNEMQLTAAEKKLVELYRAADADTKKAAVNLLKGEQEPGMADILGALLGGGKDGKTGKDGKGQSDMLASILGSAVDLLGKK